MHEEAGRDRNLPPAEREGQAESPLLFRFLGDGAATQGRPAPRPRLEKKGIRDGEVACLRLPVAFATQTGADTHRQIKERFALSRGLWGPSGKPPGWSEPGNDPVEMREIQDGSTVSLRGYDPLKLPDQLGEVVRDRIP